MGWPSFHSTPFQRPPDTFSGSGSIEHAAVDADGVDLGERRAVGQVLRHAVLPDAGDAAALVVGRLDVTAHIDVVAFGCHAVGQCVGRAVAQVLHLPVTPVDGLSVGVFQRFETCGVDVFARRRDGDGGGRAFAVAQDGARHLRLVADLELPHDADVQRIGFVVSVVEQIADRFAADDIDLVSVDVDAVAETVRRAVGEQLALAVLPQGGIVMPLTGYELLSHGVEDVRHRGLRFASALRSRDGDRPAVGQGEVDVVLVHVDEYARSVVALLAGGLVEFRPCRAVVVGDVPVLLLDFQFGRGAVLPGDGEFLAAVGDPLAVERPIVDAVGILLNGDDGRRAGFAVVDDDGRPLGEPDRVAYHASVFRQRFDGGDVVAAVECRDNSLHRAEIGVHVVAEPFESFEPLLEIVQSFHERRIVVLVVAAGQQHHAQAGEKGKQSFHGKERV